MSIKYSIIIPTRERHQTLKYAIQSVLSLQEENLEVIVCDNASTYHTKDVVSEFRDSRLLYARTEQRLSMTDNFERGIKLASGDYITVIGDDDLIIPSIFSDIQFQLNTTDVVCWFRSAYFWNDIEHPQRGVLTGSLSKTFTKIQSSKILSEAISKFANYQFLPSVYNSWVSKNVIRKIIEVNTELGINRFFCNGVISPDVFSSLLISCFTDQFVYSTIPFSLSGISSFSNGGVTNSRDRQLFAKEYGCLKIEDKYHREVKPLSNFLPSSEPLNENVRMTLSLASDYFLFCENYAKYINPSQVEKLIFAVLQSIILELKLDKNNEKFLDLVRAIGMIDQIAELFDYTTDDKDYRSYKYIYNFNVPIPNTFAVDARQWGVSNCYDAMVLYEKFLNFTEATDRYENWKYWRRFKRKVKSAIKHTTEAVKQIINRLFHTFYQ